MIGLNHKHKKALEQQSLISATYLQLFFPKTNHLIGTVIYQATFTAAVALLKISVPTGAIKTDQYGNISKANINKLFKGVGTGTTKGNNIFIGKPRGGNRPPGIYRRESDKLLRPLFYAVNKINYNSIFPAEQIAESTVQKNFGLYLRHELQKNVSKRVKQGKADLRTGLFR